MTESEDEQMSILGAFRDLLGMRKDAVETKKAKLEVKRLEQEERERETIRRADGDEVKKYDPKTKKLLDIVEGGRAPEEREPPDLIEHCLLALPGAILIFLLLEIIYRLLR